MRRSVTVPTTPCGSTARSCTPRSWAKAATWGCRSWGGSNTPCKGGRLNTDFIDNSAGVNTSDVEVNLKILLNPLVHAGRLGLKERNQLLTRMTADVAVLVLRNNYLQSQALSTLEVQAVSRDCPSISI